MTDELAVYVPAKDSELRQEIWPGSGIVGSTVGATERLRLDFEGDADVYPTFADRVRRAAERHAHARDAGLGGYPTRACAYVSPDEVTQVGRWDLDAEKLTITDDALVAEWLDRRPNAEEREPD